MDILFDVWNTLKSVKCTTEDHFKPDLEKVWISYGCIKLNKINYTQFDLDFSFEQWNYTCHESDI